MSTASPLPTQFESRQALTDFVARITPWLDQTEPSPFQGGRRAAEERLGAIQPLRSHLPVEVISEVAFVDLQRSPSLRRFFAYWKSARGQLMRP